MAAPNDVEQSACLDSTSLSGLRYRDGIWRNEQLQAKGMALKPKRRLKLERLAVDSRKCLSAARPNLKRLGRELVNVRVRREQTER